jgi:multiple sugar transport system substrate-binding protein
MSTIEVIIGEQNSDAQAWFQKTLGLFGQQNNISVKGTFYNWEDLWHELLNIGIYRRGPDLAEVGTTWMESLAAMNALRPFSKKEVGTIGGEAAFLPTSWKTASIGKNSEVWGIPFRADVRVIYYWKDIVEKAGIDPEKDFSSPAALHKAFKTLQTSLKYPWATVADPKDHNTLSIPASWVWAKGGDFISADGKSVAFNHPEALEGLNDFFSLRKFIPPSDVFYTNAKVLELFAAREIAACVGGPWILPHIQNHPLAKELAPMLGVTLPPGPAFVGGSVLVIGEYTRSPNDATELIRHLCKPEIQTQLSSYPGFLPVSVASWEETILKRPHYPIFNRALTMGRPLPVIRLWGMIEERLMTSLAQIWAALDEDPSADVMKTIKSRLDPLADRLNMTLSS